MTQYTPEAAGHSHSRVSGPDMISRGWVLRSLLVDETMCDLVLWHTCSPCIEWGFAVLEVVLTEFLVSVEKSHLNRERHSRWQTSKDCFDVILKPTEYGEGSWKHWCLHSRHLGSGTLERLQPWWNHCDWCPIFIRQLVKVEIASPHYIGVNCLPVIKCTTWCSS